MSTLAGENAQLEHLQFTSWVINMQQSPIETQGWFEPIPDHTWWGWIKRHIFRRKPKRRYHAPSGTAIQFWTMDCTVHPEGKEYDALMDMMGSIIPVVFKIDENTYYQGRAIIDGVSVGNGELHVTGVGDGPLTYISAPKPEGVGQNSED